MLSPHRQPREANMGNGTIWLYWDGPQPGYINLCLQTVLSHHSDVQLLNRARFEELWREDWDLPIDELALNHQSDFNRAYLLQHYGGLYLDVDCVVLRNLDPLLELAKVHGFVGYREPQGYMSCNFMAAQASTPHYLRPLSARVQAVTRENFFAMA